LQLQNKPRETWIRAYSLKIAVKTANNGDPFHVSGKYLKHLAATITLLHRRTFHRPIATIHAAVTGFGFNALMTIFALVKILAGICWHRFFFLIPTMGTGNN
jgi:hypothetical protein